MTTSDEQFMQQALELARQGQGLASPNPMVGALVAQGPEVVGRGFHRYDERKHAEVWALEEAGEKARGAALFLNLEPCSHVGRTGPCCDAIIRAGIRRVVAAMPDPNPLVAGGGFQKLRNAGIEVAVGVLEAEARKLNEAFTKYIQTRRPFVTLKAGMTLDGKIAAQDGSSRWITGPIAREKVQQLRHESDAILAGINTVLQDDPLLTDRSGKSRRRPLLRVVLDSQLRLPLASRLATSRAEGEVLVFCSHSRLLQRQEQLESAGVTVLPAPAGEAGIPFDFVLDQLGQREILSLLVEGGSNVNFESLRAGTVDKIQFFVAPKILGGRDAVPVVGGSGFADLEHTLPLRFESVDMVGPDLLVEAYVVK